VLEHWLGICLSECPSWYKHPELTVTVHAGLEIAAKGNVLADTDDVCEVVRLLIDMGAVQRGSNCVWTQERTRITSTYTRARVENQTC
jgi:hypothetical protein